MATQSNKRQVEIHNVSTGEVIIRQETDEEYEDRLATEADVKKHYGSTLPK